MDHDSSKESKLIEREMEVIDELYKFIRCSDIAAVRISMANCPLEFRQKLTTQYDGFSLTPLIIFAIQHASIEMLEFLVDELKFIIDDKPIRVSVHHDSLMSSAFNSWIIPLKYNICYLSPLHFAICMKPSSLEKIKFLVDRGADINATTSNGVTSLMLAAHGDFGVCEFLIDKGANIGAVNDKGQTALHLALIAGYIPTAQLLVEKGADPFHRANNGDDPISIACCESLDCCEKASIVFLDAFCHRANAFQLQLIGKYRRLVSYRRLKWVITNRPNSRQPKKLEDVKRDLELGLELTREIFGHEHRRFYEASRETASCYFTIRFYGQWLRQLVHNFQTLCNPDLNDDTSHTEFELMFRDIQRNIIELKEHKRDTSNFSLGFEAFDEFLEIVIEQALNCSYAKRDLMIVLILLLIRLALLVDCENQRRQSFRNLVRRGLRLRTRTGYNMFLMIATRDCLYRPWARSTLNIITLLLECGANVNECGEFGHNLAHLLQRSDCTDTAKRLAQTFVEYGVHLDAVSREGITIASSLRKFGIEAEVSLCLKCLAARAIRRSNISFAGMIPACLEEFVKMH